MSDDLGELAADAIRNGGVPSTEITAPHTLSTKIEPALTAEEWHRALSVDYDIVREDDARWSLADERLQRTNSDYHGTAALALYGQPFGFTREDVTDMRIIAESVGRAYVPPTSPEAELANDVFAGIGKRLSSIAARIEALLPPE